MGSKDTNYPAGEYADRDGLYIFGAIYDPRAEGMLPGSFADTLKLSHITNSQYDTGTVQGGKENAIDANRGCRNVTVRNYKLNGGDQAAIVVKGDCQGMNFQEIEITPSPAAKCDILWDDWSDQSRKASTGTLRGVYRTDGKPVRIVFGRFKRPVERLSMTPARYEILWWETVKLHLYNYLWKGPLRSLKIL